MTVRELIDRLSRFPDDHEIRVASYIEVPREPGKKRGQSPDRDAYQIHEIELVHCSIHHGTKVPENAISIEICRGTDE